MKGNLLEMERECYISSKENLTNLGTISQLEDTFHGVDGDDDWF